MCVRWNVAILSGTVPSRSVSSCAVESLECCFPLGSLEVNVIVLVVSFSNCGFPHAVSCSSCSPCSAGPNLLWPCMLLPHCFRAKTICEIYLDVLATHMCHLPYNCHLHSQWTRLRHTKVACHIHVSFAPALTETRRSGSLVFTLFHTGSGAEILGEWTGQKYSAR